MEKTWRSWKKKHWNSALVTRMRKQLRKRSLVICSNHVRSSGTDIDTFLYWDFIVTNHKKELINTLGFTGTMIQETYPSNSANLALITIKKNLPYNHRIQGRYCSTFEKGNKLSGKMIRAILILLYDKRIPKHQWTSWIIECR